MAYKRPYQPYSFDQSDRKTLTITNFGGVDLSSQKLNVSSNRAIQLLNFVYRDGLIRKRYGYEQVYQLKEKTYKNENNEDIVNSTNFNGIWKFVAEDGNEHIVAHIGSFLFEVKGINTDNLTFEFLKNYGESFSYQLKDEKSFAFVSGNKLWVLGGISYLCVRFNGFDKIIAKCEEIKECFVPTTTYSITESYVDLGETANIRVNNQPVNLLTMWRKNACITGVQRKEDIPYAPSNFVYELDAPIVFKNESDMNDFHIRIETVD